MILNIKMFGKRLLNNKHKLNLEFKNPIDNKNNYLLNKKPNEEEIKFNTENESEINFVNFRKNEKEINNNNTFQNNNDNTEKEKEKKKSVIVNKPGNFFSFSSGINLNEDNEIKEKYRINSPSGNLKDSFYSQNYFIDNGNKKKVNDMDYIFSPLTQEDINKINKDNENNKNKFKQKKLNPLELNINKINNYQKKSEKIKNNDEIDLNLNDDDPYCVDDESSCGNQQKISKKQFKLMDKLGIDLEDEENLNNDIDKIIKDKVERIKEVKDHQRKCLLVENLDGLYGKSQNPDDIIKGIYSTLNDENNDSEYEEEIDQWEKAQFKSGIKLNQLKMNDKINSKDNYNEINFNYKNNNLYEKLNKKEELEFDELVDDFSQIIVKDKSLLNNYVNKKNDYSLELTKLINNEKKLEKELDFYINQYTQLKKMLINSLKEKNEEDQDNNMEEELEKAYISN